MDTLKRLGWSHDVARNWFDIQPVQTTLHKTSRAWEIPKVLSWWKHQIYQILTTPCWTITHTRNSTSYGMVPVQWRTLGKTLWFLPLPHNWYCKGDCTKSSKLLPLSWPMRQHASKGNYWCKTNISTEKSRATQARVKGKICLHSLYSKLNEELHWHRRT